ncbi:hypothetical protein [Laspinema olomoucense]|uniref:Uncharacterized protein n=1 Tax=Laspinema olomoucense D3b TaxID=2953688 RepID=A0ABT2N7M5_9CYAN|nr:MULTISPECIES: hypothetical protein [unclassified Laspinema]MCT7973596.1 hypothetical protein [Laspinema sp. D3d]MCT7978697.1 hypothetical protein [Laspinema sp. D3b]MCT7989359.1 hypothetical protein [Laspinema sp. D3a]MCT7992362.1 hypothetical protein [Laspinema sp. D3c]
MMKPLQKTLATTVGLSLLFWSTPSLADQNLRLTWVRMDDTNQDGCVRQAVEAMKSTGLMNVEVQDNELVEGEASDLEAKIMCIETGRELIAAIAVASDSSSDAREIRGSLRDYMRR